MSSSSGMGSSPPRRVSCPSRSLSLVCKIPRAFLGLSETNTIGSIVAFHATVYGPDFPVLRFFQESAVYASASLLTLRSLGSQGPHIENRKVPHGGASGAEAHLS